MKVLPLLEPKGGQEMLSVITQNHPEPVRKIVYNCVKSRMCQARLGLAVAAAAIPGVHMSGSSAGFVLPPRTWPDSGVG